MTAASCAAVTERSPKRCRASPDSLFGQGQPDRGVIRLFCDEGAGVEIASLGEYRAAQAAGVKPDDILFAGPAKGARELEIVVAGGIGEIHLESFEEIARLTAIAARLNVTVPVSIRVNPVASAQGGAMRMGGKPAPFGFDEETIGEVVGKVQSAPELDLRGVHLFAGTQILDEAVLLAQWRHGIDVAGRVAAIAGQPLKTIDLGGGLGIPYFSGRRTTRSGKTVRRITRAPPAVEVRSRCLPTPASWWSPAVFSPDRPESMSPGSMPRKSRAAPAS